MANDEKRNISLFSHKTAILILLSQSISSRRHFGYLLHFRFSARYGSFAFFPNSLGKGHLRNVAFGEGIEIMFSLESIWSVRLSFECTDVGRSLFVCLTLSGRHSHILSKFATERRLEHIHTGRTDNVLSHWYRRFTYEFRTYISHNIQCLITVGHDQ